MMIYIDPSEARPSSRLSRDVIDQSVELEHLEEYTGADILISSEKTTLRALDDSVPSQMALKQHCRTGILVQRKTGLDLVQSIPKLREIAFRMLQWNENPFLLTVGDYKCSKDGFAFVDGRKTKYSYASLVGALTWWQLYSRADGSGRCCHVNVSRDGLVWKWISSWDRNKLRKLHSGRAVRVIREIARVGLLEPDWTTTIRTFPGMGEAKTLGLREYVDDEGLAWALQVLCDPHYAGKIPYPDGDRKKTIGKTQINKIRKYLGIRDGYTLTITKEDR